MRVKITPSEKEFEVTVHRGIKLQELKEICVKELGEQITIKLVYRGKILKDSDDLSILQPNTVLFLVKEMKKAEEPPKPAPAQVPPSSASNPPGAQSSPFMNPGFGGMAGLPGGMGGMGGNSGGGGGMPGSGMPGMGMPGTGMPGMGMPGMGMPGMGMPGMGMPGMPGVNPAQMGMVNGLMQDPAMRESLLSQMQAIFSNPQTRDFYLNSNPMLKSMYMQNPAIFDMMADPQMINMMRGMFSGGGGGGGGGGFGMPNPMMGLGGSNPMANPIPSPQPAANPRETYASQLQQLKEMGFYDEDKCIKALQATGGDVNAAVEKLFSS